MLSQYCPNSVHIHMYVMHFFVANSVVTTKRLQNQPQKDFDVVLWFLNSNVLNTDFYSSIHQFFLFPVKFQWGFENPGLKSFQMDPEDLISNLEDVQIGNILDDLHGYVLFEFVDCKDNHQFSWDQNDIFHTSTSRAKSLSSIFANSECNVEYWRF